MTLPFRRRHNDQETSHDRARLLASDRLMAPLAGEDEAWLATHLEGCGECRRATESFEADRALLRTLRDDQPTPPRDLWARTAAAIERESGRPGRAPARTGGARGGRGRPLPWWPRLTNGQLGTLSGALVVLVVVGASIWSQPGIPIVSPTGTPRASVSPEPTPLTVAANGLSWISTNEDGTYDVTFARVNSVCAPEDTGCAPLHDAVLTTITLEDEPQAVVISPTSEELVIVTAQDAGSSVFVMPVGTPGPTDGPSTPPSMPPSAEPTPKASAVPSKEPSIPPSNLPSIEPSGLPSISPSFDASLEPSIGPSGQPSGSPQPTPTGATAIATGVSVVGEPLYSPDGQWFAFAARPADGSGGPDLWVWHAGDPQATQMTFNGRSVLAGWAGSYVLGSHVSIDDAPVFVDGSPAPSGEASAEPTETPVATATPEVGPTASIDPSAPVPSPTPDISPHVSQTFLLDPASGAVTFLLDRSVWRPAVDPLGTRVVYWDGQVVGDGKGGWVLGAGRLVLDTWTTPPPPAPDASIDPNATPGVEASAPPEPTETATADPSASPEPTPLPPGPAGTPQVLFETDTPIVDFDARFDPTGTRLAVWIEDATDPSLGRLHLFVIDPVTGAIDTTLEPLRGVPALRGFSIEHNRLAWVTPPGQDGDDSRISVLAWRGNQFGQNESNPGNRLKIVR
jgi:hypothetical protein